MELGGRSGFHDHFSQVATGYAAHRPTYPATVVDLLATLAPRCDLAWDCGCGSGQLSVLLAGRFARVIAPDASAEQIAKGRPHRGPIEAFRRDLARVWGPAGTVRSVY